MTLGWLAFYVAILFVGAIINEVRVKRLRDRITGLENTVHWHCMTDPGKSHVHDPPKGPVTMADVEQAVKNGDAHPCGKGVKVRMG